MARKDKKTLPASGAGIVRYFNDDTAGVKLSPKQVVIGTIIVLRNRYARQTAAVAEGLTANACHTLRDRHNGQAAAAREGRVADSRHALQDRR